MSQTNRLCFGSLHIAIQSFCCWALMLQPATYSHSSIDSLRSFLFGLRASCMFFFFVHVKCLWPWYQFRLHSHFSSILWIFKKCGVYQHVQRWQISTTTAESSAAASQGAALVETWDPWQPVPMPCRKRVWQKNTKDDIIIYYLILLDGQIFIVHSYLSFLLVFFSSLFWIVSHVSIQIIFCLFTRILQSHHHDGDGWCRHLLCMCDYGLGEPGQTVSPLCGVQLGEQGELPLLSGQADIAHSVQSFWLRPEEQWTIFVHGSYALLFIPIHVFTFISLYCILGISFAFVKEEGSLLAIIALAYLTPMLLGCCILLCSLDLHSRFRDIEQKCRDDMF